MTTLTTTMTAVVQHGYGDADVLRVEEVPTPTPGKDQVLLRVDAAALDHGTWHLMTGTPRMLRLFLGWKGPRGRFVPGRDVAGTVVAVGERVTRFRVGDRVFGAATGSLAAYAVAHQAKLAAQPPGVTAPQAAVLAISGLTALQALDAGRGSRGDRVLVVGASGGVGSYAVQLAAARGALVTGVCSAAKADAVRAWGAGRVLDYATTDPTDPATLTDGTPYDVVLDIAGGASLRSMRRVLAPRGTLVFVGDNTGGEWTGGYGRPMRSALRMLLSRQRFVMLTAREKAPEDLERLADAVAAGELVPPVHAVRPLAQIREAMADLAGGAVAGKIAVQVAD